MSTVFGYCFLLNLPTNLKVAICTPNRRIFYILGVVNWEISVRLSVKDVLTSCRHEEAFGTFSVPRAEGLRQLLIAGPEVGMQTSRIIFDLMNRKHGDRVLF